MKSALLLLCIALATSCVAKSTYLQKIDEAVRFRTQAEQCTTELRRLGEIRADLEDQIRGVEKRLAVTALDRERCRKEVEQHNAEIARLRESLQKSNDTVNELRTRLALSAEQVRGLKGRIAQLQEEARREPDLSDVEAALKTELESTPALSLVRGKGFRVLRIPHEALFRRRTAALTREGRALLGRLADALGRLSGRSFRIQGHQDNAPVPRRMGSVVELSVWQAVAVGMALVRAGLDSMRVFAAGFGAARPAAAGEDESARAANRRIEIVITPLDPADQIDVIGPEGLPRKGG
jgi:chemotaxis protein MotB